MIILGDVASPTEEHSAKFKDIIGSNPDVFKGKSLLCNLEGLLKDNNLLRTDTPILYNDHSIFGVLSDANVIGVGLANNHTLDLPYQFDETKQLLSNAGIKYVGAGRSKTEAETPITVFEAGKKILIYNYCWDFLLYHQKNPSTGVYIAELDELALIEEIKSAKFKEPDTEMVVFIHWSFDLETIPFPLYRQFSKALIDNGVSIVVGCHSHCVQGGEQYRDGVIVYGLGNFFIPNKIYAGGKLSFPEMSKMQLAFEFDFVTKKAKCHWFKYDDKFQNLVRYIITEDFENSQILTAYSPYAELSHSEYIKYFKKNRRKKLLVPIFKNINDVQINDAKIRWLKVRARFLRFLSKYRIRGWQN